MFIHPKKPTLLLSLLLLSACAQEVTVFGTEEEDKFNQELSGDPVVAIQNRLARLTQNTNLPEENIISRCDREVENGAQVSFTDGDSAVTCSGFRGRKQTFSNPVTSHFEVVYKPNGADAAVRFACSSDGHTHFPETVEVGNIVLRYKAQPFKDSTNYDRFVFGHKQTEVSRDGFPLYRREDQNIILELLPENIKMSFLNFRKYCPK